MRKQFPNSRTITGRSPNRVGIIDVLPVTDFERHDGSVTPAVFLEVGYGNSIGLIDEPLFDCPLSLEGAVEMALSLLRKVHDYDHAKYFEILSEHGANQFVLPMRSIPGSDEGAVS